MSRNHNPYIFYTEYYLISGAYQVINVVNEILTYSASYSDNIKEYLRNQVASKQVALNELVRNEHDARVNANTKPDNDVDEDGFVVIKLRRSKKNKNELSVINSSNNNSSNNLIHMIHDIRDIHDNKNMDQNKNLKDNIHSDISDIIQQIVENMIKDVIKKLDTNINIEN